MFEFIQNQMASNQFLVAALGGGVFWYLVGIIRQVYAFLSRCYYRWCVYTVRLNNDSSMYIPCVNFFYEKVKHKVKNINLQKNYNNEVVKSPGYDWHIFIEGFNLVYFTIVEEKQEMGRERREYISVKIHGFGGKKITDALSKSIIEQEKIMYERQRVYHPSSYGDGWRTERTLRHRSIDSIFIDKDIKNSIINKIDSFYSNMERFKEIGICHKTGFVFFGQPGVGKSTLIQALATKYKKNICYLNLSSIKDSGLQACFNNIPDNSFLVFEDIDCHAKSVKRDEEEGNIATLLQCLDGVNMPDGTILFATTNRMENIDPAVIRSGRFDHKIELLPATKEIATDMINAINPDKAYLLDELTYPVAQCDLQTKLLEE